MTPPRSVTDQIAVRTHDLDEFVALVNALFGPHRLRLGAGGLAGSVLGHRCGQLIVGQLNYGTEAHALVEEERDGWVMTHPVGADGSWDAQRFEPDELMMYAPSWCGRIGMRGSTWMRNIYMPQQVLQEHLADLLGSTPQVPLRFDQRLPLHAPAAARLRQMAAVLQDPQHPAAALPALQRAWQATFCLELLSLWPHNFSRTLNDQGPALPRAVQRACECLEDHLLRQPGEPLPVTALARAACVGVRALELAFRKHLGTTPLRYLRQRRLDGARADLQAHRAAGRLRVAEVAEVAAKWGFSSPGQFARAYQQRFGVLPGRR
jgi:AraC-like DNA-binding protein